jgi:hypothetical protein
MTYPQTIPDSVSTIVPPLGKRSPDPPEDSPINFSTIITRVLIEVMALFYTRIPTYIINTIPINNAVSMTTNIALKP